MCFKDLTWGKLLKIELSHRTANTPHNKYVPGATGNSTMIQTGAHQGVGADMEKASSVETNQPRPTSVGASPVPRCRKCGSTVSHQPSQCPAKNFVCEKCSKRGHHTFNCMHICAGCGGKRVSCYDPANCVAKNMNCAYCGVKGHLAHVCLQKRYDELGYLDSILMLDNFISVKILGTKINKVGESYYAANFA